MCVIAYKPENKKFTENELREMFRFNPDGAGFAVRNPKNGKVIFEKGIMSEQKFIRKVIPFNRKELELVIHCRITSRGVTNKKQTHPFKSQSIKSMGHLKVKGDLYFMNGTIMNIIEKPGFNDTMSFIEGMQLNKVEPNQKLIDTIGDITDSKWLVVNEKNILFTKDFIKKHGKWYSNLYHEGYYGDYYDNCYDDQNEPWEFKIDDYFSQDFIKRAKDDELYDVANNFIEELCSINLCEHCSEGCFIDTKDYGKFKDRIEAAIENIIWSEETE